MRIDFISDIVCPWCAIGVSALERALERIGNEVTIDLHFRAFELNAEMPAAGEDLEHYLMQRVGMNQQQVAASHAMLRERGAAVGFEFGHRTRIWNTFDAHRLLKWAAATGPAGSQRRLKLALLRACHGHDRNPGAHDVLLELARELGLDTEGARTVLAGSAFADDVRNDQRQWREAGIASVPTLVVDGTYVLTGAQSPDEYERALRELSRRRRPG